MKTKGMNRIISFLLAGAMIFNLSAMGAYADEAKDAGSGKYVSDVFIAYGKTEDKAKAWLEKNGWEPVAGDFNAGKASFFDDNKIQDQNVAAVMGIKRTDDKDKAITDMAVMNMKGGYSLPKYEELIDQKKSEINEMINRFMVVIGEYRANLAKEEDDFGKKRADFAYDMLNKFYDGDPEGENAVNDTGWKLGDFFNTPTRQEGNEEGGDLEQLMLESSGPASLAVETILVVAADTGEETWLERASGLTGDELSENLVKYAPEAEGQDVAPSAIPQYLGQTYGDTAGLLCNQWNDVHDDIIWFESYNKENGLWQQDDETDDDYKERVDQYFDDLKSSDEDAYGEVYDKYNRLTVLYNRLYEVPYEGEWGETLGDFFNPAEDAEFSSNTDHFLPLAAALSDGQRAGLEFLSLEMLLLIGLGTEEGLDQIVPEIQKVFGDKEEIDIFTGVNRAAFRGGVALTSEALMEQNAGKGNAFDKIWDNTGIVAITSYCSAFVGLVTMGVGAYMMKTGVVCITPESTLRGLRTDVTEAEMAVTQYKIDHVYGEVPEKLNNNLKTAEAKLAEAKSKTQATSTGVAGRWVLGIGGAILIGAAIVKAVQMYKYYDRKMTPIPRMIVGESDIVTYLTDEKTGKPLLDENGKQKKNIDFNTYEYYTAVKCNRPDVGEIGDWQDGVKEYENKENYCYDIADLNCDMGQEWVALYTVKSKNKGNPVMADSLTMQYGKKGMPEDCKKALHLFTYSNAVDLGDTAWAFNNDKKGVYFFWNEDEMAFASSTASVFSGRALALAGFGGLILGLAGATLVLRPRRKKEEEAA